MFSDLPIWVQIWFPRQCNVRDDEVDLDGGGQQEPPACGEHLCRVEVEQREGEAAAKPGDQLGEAMQHLETRMCVSQRQSIE